MGYWLARACSRRPENPKRKAAIRALNVVGAGRGGKSRQETKGLSTGATAEVEVDLLYFEAVCPCEKVRMRV